MSNVICTNTQKIIIKTICKQPGPLRRSFSFARFRSSDRAGLFFCLFGIASAVLFFCSGCGPLIVSGLFLCSCSWIGFGCSWIISTGFRLWSVSGFPVVLWCYIFRKFVNTSNLRFFCRFSGLQCENDTVFTFHGVGCFWGCSACRGCVLACFLLSVLIFSGASPGCYAVSGPVRCQDRKTGRNVSTTETFRFWEKSCV